MNELTIVPEKDVIARRKNLDRTREWCDFNEVKKWEPGETHRCDYNTLLKDFGLSTDRTKSRSFLITFRDNLNWLWTNEDYPQLQAQQVKLKSGQWVMYVTRVPDMGPISEKCPKVEIIEIPEATAKAQILSENQELDRGPNGTIVRVHTAKGWVKQENVSKEDWETLLNAEKAKGYPELAALYGFVDQTGIFHKRGTYEKSTKVVEWINEVGISQNIPIGGTVHIEYAGKLFTPAKQDELSKADPDLFKTADELKQIAADRAEEKAKKAKEAADKAKAEDAANKAKADIITAAIDKVKAGETDIEKIVSDARADAIAAGIVNIGELVADVRTKVEEELKAQTPKP